MQTLSEIDAEKQAKREKAAAYERLVDDRVRYTKAVDILVPGIATREQTLAALATIEKACEVIPPTVQGVGGQQAKAQILNVIGQAKQSEQTLLDKAVRTLALARERLDHANAEIAKLEQQEMTGGASLVA